MVLFTFSWILSLAAALPFSIAKKAFVIATLILSTSKLTTLPFLLITLIFPGAFIANSLACFCCVACIFVSSCVVSFNDIFFSFNPLACYLLSFFVKLVCGCFFFHLILINALFYNAFFNPMDNITHCG